MTDPDPSRDRPEPTVTQPLNGPRKGWVRPLVYLIALIVVLVLLYWFGSTVLIDAD